MAYGSFEADGITVQSSEHSDEQLASNLTAVEDIAVESDAVPEPVEPVAPVVDEKRPTNAEARKDPQAKIRQQTFDQREAERRADAAEKKAAALEAQIAAAKAPKPEMRAVPPPAAAADPEPTVDQFDTYEKFVKAQARWEAEQAIQQREQKRQEHETQQREEHYHREVNDAFYERYGKILDAEPEYAKKLFPSLINSVRYGMLSAEEKKTASSASVIMEEVFHSENPRALLDYVHDPAHAQRLATLPPTKLRRELARVEFGAASPAAPAPAAPVSHAKAPIRPVVSSPVATDANEITDDLSVDEHIRRMNARDRTERRRAS